MPDSTEDMETPHVRDANPWGVDDEDDTLRPEEHYEHQGEITEMEESARTECKCPLSWTMRRTYLHLDLRAENLRSPYLVEKATLGFDGAPAPRQPLSKSQSSAAYVEPRLHNELFRFPDRSAKFESARRVVYPTTGPQSVTMQHLASYWIRRSHAPHRLSVAEKAGLEQVCGRKKRSRSHLQTHNRQSWSRRQHENRNKWHLRTMLYFPRGRVRFARKTWRLHGAR